MGLRDYLATLGLAEKSTAEFAQTAENMRKAAAEQEYIAQAPELFRLGKVEEAAALAQNAGIKEPMNALFKSKFDAEIAKQKSTDKVVQSLSKAELIMQGLDPAKAAVFAQRPYDQQMDAVKNVGSAEVREIQKVGEARREKQVTFQRGQALAKEVAPIQKEILQDESALQKVNEAFKSNTIPGDAIVMNFIARKMADEKGPLAEGDIVRLTGKTFAGDTNSALNWVQSAAAPTAPPEQRAAYKELLNLARNNFEANKEAKLVAALGRAALANEELIVDGKPTESLQKIAKEMKFAGVKVNSDGNFELIKKSKTAPTSLFTKEGNADFEAAKAQAELIKDPEHKEWVKKQIDKMIEASKNKAIPKDKIKSFFDAEITAHLPQ
jgi:hypothetical protein